MAACAPVPRPNQAPVVDGLETIQELGHREFVGGMWEEIGKLQFDFLVQNGLCPHHRFLDVACGCLRGGRHVIPYLNRGNYLGIDKEQFLIDSGIQEIGPATLDSKKPEFVVSRSFEFEKFSVKPEYALAQSLFTHLVPDDIRLCLSNLRDFVNPGHVFFATFFVGLSDVNPEESNSRQCFWYSMEQMAAFGQQSGWHTHFHGDWDHPRGQQMMRYIAV